MSREPSKVIRPCYIDNKGVDCCPSCGSHYSKGCLPFCVFVAHADVFEKAAKAAAQAKADFEGVPLDETDFL